MTRARRYCEISYHPRSPVPLLLLHLSYLCFVNTQKDMGASGSHDSGITPAVQFPFEELPEELIVHILTFVPAKDIILNLRRVCKSWKVIIDSKSLWIAKCHRDNVALPPFVLYDETFPIDFKKLCVQKPFNRNLLHNWNGAGNLAKSMWSTLFLTNQWERKITALIISILYDCRGFEILANNRKSWR